MLYLEQLKINQFRNFKEAEFRFCEKINCITGNNGIGKTNILDAVYYLCLGKSYFNSIDAQNIYFDAPFFSLQGNFFRKDQWHKISCQVVRGEKKVLKKDEKTYRKIGDHLGAFPLVIVSPYDNDLLQEGSQARRRFIDSIICQFDAKYFQNLSKYKKLLQQRNALLRFFAKNHIFNHDDLAIYDTQMQPLNLSISQERRRFIMLFTPIFKAHYKAISQDKEMVSLNYVSLIEDSKNIEEQWRSYIQKDRLLQHSSMGIHKDDLEILIHKEKPVKRFASQGQQKSVLIALKLAQFDFLKQQTKLTPILLLDDVFDKLDPTRVKELISRVNQDYFGQIFITDTDIKRMQTIVEGLEANHKIISLT